MCDNTFKTPRKLASSDESSSESGQESAGWTGSSGSGDVLSIEATFDDLWRWSKQRRNSKVEEAFFTFAVQTKELLRNWSEVVAECRRLQDVVEKKNAECCDLEKKLGIARKLLDLEKRSTKKAEGERRELEVQLNEIRGLLLGDKRNHLHDDTRERLVGISDKGLKQLSAIAEINSTGSILSDLSYSRSEDDLDTSKPGQSGWKKVRCSSGVPEQPLKKRRSSSNKFVEIGEKETVRATTTVTVTKEGPITATSVIESVPESDHFSTPHTQMVLDSWKTPQITPKKFEQRGLKPHSFQPKVIVLRETCRVCDTRIKFGRHAMKCKECRAICHAECKTSLPTPCIPCANTPNHRQITGLLSDYTPTTPPMIPALIIHCINEIEARGLSEVGLYRVPGSEKDVKSLKEKFLNGNGAPVLKDIDIHAICGTVKDFLRSFSDPLTTSLLRDSFIKAVNHFPEDIPNKLMPIIAQLPQANRDTLAYLMLHLKKIANSKACKMPINNISKVFAPTLIGYSSKDPDPASFLSEVQQDIEVMDNLLALPGDYWAQFLHVTPVNLGGKLQQTPSTDSLLRPTGSRGLFTPSRATLKKKYFCTPPDFK